MHDPLDQIWVIILVSGLLTYLTRIGGHLLIARVGTIHPRLDAALNAVPAAVLVTIVVPLLVDGTWIERFVLLACALAAIRLPPIVAVLLGTAAVALARSAGL